MINTLKMTYDFQEPIKQLGDVVEVNGLYFLLRGISRFKMWGRGMEVVYITQQLTEDTYSNLKQEEVVEEKTITLEMDRHSEYSDWDRYHLGMLVLVDEMEHQIVEWRGFSFDDEKLMIEAATKPIRLVHPNEVSLKQLEAQKKGFKIKEC